jgi:hypothetical protein
MKKALEMTIKGAATLLGLLLVSVTISAADERYVLQYDAPAKDNLLVRQRGRTRGLGYIQTALPVGNGRLGATCPWPSSIEGVFRRLSLRSSLRNTPGRRRHDHGKLARHMDPRWGEVRHHPILS